MAWEHVGAAMRRSGLFGTGPYESSGEAELGDRLRSALVRDASLETQVEVSTIAGKFRLDMLLRSPTGRRIALEVDGAQFHDRVRDFWRTILIFGTESVDIVYRIPGNTLVPSRIACLLDDLGRQESDSFHAWSLALWREAAESLEAEQDAASDDGRPTHWMTRYRRARHVAKNNEAKASGWSRFDPTWWTYFDFAKTCGAADIEGIRRAWRKRERPG